MAKVSVIVPIYNAEKYLEKCIDSLLNQTLNDIEIILIDDASKDKSLSIATSYQKTNPSKIKLIYNKENKGVAAARNTGLDISTGEYIGFVDSDDYIENNMYEKMVNACEKTGSEIARINKKIVYHGMDVSFLGRNSDYNTSQIIDPRTDKKYLTTETPACTTKIFKSSLAKDTKFKEGIKWEDYPYTIPLLVEANQVVTVPDTCYYYSLNFSGTTVSDAKRLNKNLLDIFDCSDIIGDTCLTENAPENLQRQIRYVQIQNCLQRLRDILYSNIPIKEKKELISLVSSLINLKYGDWQSSEVYKEQKASRRLYRINMGIIENYFITPSTQEQTEEQIKQKIKMKINENTK